MYYIVMKNSCGCEIAVEPVPKKETPAKTICKLLESKEWLIEDGDSIEIRFDDDGEE